MFHTLANFVSIGQTVDTDVPPVTDSVILIQNAHWVFQNDMFLLAAAAMSTTLNRVRLSQPTLRVMTTPWLRPLIRGSVPPTIPNVCDYRRTPLRLRGLEELQVLATSGLGAGNEPFTCIMNVGDAITPIPAGDVITMRGTSTTAAVANAWTQITTTWQDTLPQGTYGIVGLQHESANAIAARLIINGQYWRPGAISVDGFGNSSNLLWLKGGMGLWGQFKQTAMPIVEVMCNAADAVHEVYLEFVRMA